MDCAFGAEAATAEGATHPVHVQVAVLGASGSGWGAEKGLWYQRQSIHINSIIDINVTSIKGQAVSGDPPQYEHASHGRRRWPETPHAFVQMRSPNTAQPT